MTGLTEEADVAVVGAGGGGAVLALALAQQGIRTIVLDQAQGPPQGLRGELLQPNGQSVLDRLRGFARAVQSRDRDSAECGAPCDCRRGTETALCESSLSPLIRRIDS